VLRITQKQIPTKCGKDVYLEVVAEFLDFAPFAPFSISEFAPFVPSLYYTTTSKIVKKNGANRANSENVNGIFFAKLCATTSK
jgi:hypothetical protein